MYHAVAMRSVAEFMFAKYVAEERFDTQKHVMASAFFDRLNQLYWLMMAMVTWCMAENFVIGFFFSA